MLDWLIRWWRVEVALFICYFDSLRRGDRESYQYCAQKSMLVSVFCFAAFMGALMLLGSVIRFFQYGGR